MNRIQLDGEILIYYLRTELKLGKIAIHGESLGGSIACYLAKKCNLDFLFADRSLSSLAEAGFFNYGKLCYWALKIFLHSDCDTVSDFLGTKCYKLLSADHKDLMIHDLASLKSGVALRFLFPNYSVLSFAYTDAKCLKASSHILQSADICNLFSALKNLLNQQKTNEELTEVINKIEEIDAGGRNLIEVLNDKFPYLNALL